MMFMYWERDLAWCRNFNPMRHPRSSTRSSTHAFYNTVTAAAAGYPIINTTVCPVNATGICNYQLFSSNYALFVMRRDGSVGSPTSWISSACDGTAASYQVSFAKQAGATVIDLTGTPVAPIAANSGVAFQVVRASGVLSVSPAAIMISSAVNAAGLGPGLSAGGIFTIFGAGLATSGSVPAVTIGRQAAPILAGLPFQINALIPAGIPEGSAVLQVTSAIGTATQNVTLAGVAPGIFVIGTAPNGKAPGAVVESGWLGEAGYRRPPQ
jgi:hypothetical protein